MAKKVMIDTDDCVDCGTCAELCPAAFELDEEAGKALVIMPSGGPEDCIEEAIDTCPMSCIHWED